MKKWQIGLIVVGVLILLTGCAITNGAGWFIKTSNQIQTSDQARKAQWANVQASYQQRYDLIPNLVKIVERYAKHESDTFKGVAEARSKAGGVFQVDPNKVADQMKDPQAFAAFQQSQGQLGTMLGRLMVIQEKYPELKADAQFTKLLDQDTDIENQIKFERRKYTDKVQDENNLIKNMPTSWIAQFQGYKELPYFAADSGAEKAPAINFGQ